MRQFGAAARQGCRQISGLDGKAQGHEAPVRDSDMRGTQSGRRTRAQWEASSEEWMSGVGDLNLGHLLWWPARSSTFWALEGGSKIGDRMRL